MARSARNLAAQHAVEAIGVREFFLNGDSLISAFNRSCQQMFPGALIHLSPVTLPVPTTF